MQKRKTKFNILDLAIILVAVCSFCLIFFRDTVSEVLGAPQMGIIEIIVEIEGEDAVSEMRQSVGKTVLYETEKEGEYSEFYISDVKTASDSLVAPNKATVVFTCTGYNKLGRYYTENGKRIFINTTNAYVLNEIRVECKVVSVNKKG